MAQRVADGKSNAVRERATRSITDIVRANVFTRINAILGVLLLIVLATGSLINGMFGLLIIANSVDRHGPGDPGQADAGQARDRRAGETVGAQAIRDASGAARARWCSTTSSSSGPVIRSSSTARSSKKTNLEVDESLLTGEADPIAKAVGDAVMSGSFVVAGAGAYRATKVGPEAYAAKLAEEASKFTLVKSELRNGINRILQFVTYLLVPAGLLTIYTQLFTTTRGWRESVLRTVGALVPMVPEGLVLLTSVAFAVGVVRLGQRQCLVQELPAIEGLARVDVVCADKTGTLTENGMRVSRRRGARRMPRIGNGRRRAGLAGRRRPAAQCEHAGDRRDLSTSPPAGPPRRQHLSSRPPNGAACPSRDHGNWVIGAPDVLLDPASAAAEQAERIGAQGLRVLLLGAGDVAVDHPDAPGRGHPRRAGGAGTEGAPGCPRNPGLLC